jgi:hypothetical protein
VVNLWSSLAAWAKAWLSWAGRGLGRAGRGGVLGGAWSDRLGQ